MFRKTKSIIKTKFNELFGTIRLLFTKISIHTPPLDLSSFINTVSPIAINTASLPSGFDKPLIRSNAMHFSMELKEISNIVYDAEIKSEDCIITVPNIHNIEARLRRTPSIENIKLLEPPSRTLLSSEFSLKNTKIFKIRAIIKAKFFKRKNLSSLSTVIYKGKKAELIPKKYYIKTLIKVMSRFKLKREEIIPMIFFSNIMIWDEKLVKFIKPDKLKIQIVKDCKAVRKDIIIAKIKNEKFARLFVL